MILALLLATSQSHDPIPDKLLRASMLLSQSLERIHSESLHLNSIQNNSRAESAPRPFTADDERHRWDELFATDACTVDWATLVAKVET